MIRQTVTFTAQEQSRFFRKKVRGSPLTHVTADENVIPLYFRKPCRQIHICKNIQMENAAHRCADHLGIGPVHRMGAQKHSRKTEPMGAARQRAQIARIIDLMED